MSRYAVVNQNGRVVNTVTWDGSAPYDPGHGLTPVRCPDDVTIGWQQDGDNWIRPGAAPPADGEVIPEEAKKRREDHEKREFTPQHVPGSHGGAVRINPGTGLPFPGDATASRTPTADQSEPVIPVEFPDKAPTQDSVEANLQGGHAEPEDGEPGRVHRKKDNNKDKAEK